MPAHYLKLLLGSCILSCINLSANAASFDCRKASGTREEAICKNKSLSVLDDKVEALYKEALAIAKDRDALIRMQNHWLAYDTLDENSLGYCSHDSDAGPLLPCLTKRYQERLDGLTALKSLLQKPDQPVEKGWRFDFSRVSTNYDISLRMLKKCDVRSSQGGFVCEEPGVVYISKKGQTTPMFITTMNNIILSLHKTEAASGNKPVTYGTDWTVRVADFNFDGEEDIAVFNGNNGPYKSDTYDIYLKLPGQDNFQFSQELTGLSYDSLGLFKVDKKRRRLISAEKTGYTYSALTEYQVIDNKPVPTIKKIDDGHFDEKYRYFYEDHWVNGDWKRVKTRRVKKR